MIEGFMAWSMVGASIFSFINCNYNLKTKNYNWALAYGISGTFLLAMTQL